MRSGDEWEERSSGVERILKSKESLRLVIARSRRWTHKIDGDHTR